jgi:Na+/H+ antiporter NhaD/arsenite permease-like protein
LLLTVAMAVVILSALGFRAYRRLYSLRALPHAALALLHRHPDRAAGGDFVRHGLPPAVTRTLLLLAGIAMLIGAGIGVYHAGVEWKFWEGPASCSTSVNA